MGRTSSYFATTVLAWWCCFLIGSRCAAPADESSTWLDQVWVNHLLWRAERYSNHLVAAEAACRQALLVDPRNDRCLRRLLDIYRRGGHAPMVAMLSGYGTHVAGISNMAPVFSSVWSRVVCGAAVPEPNDELDTAAAEFRELLDRARDQIRQRNLVAAEMSLRRLLDRYPRNLPCLLHLGNVYVLAREWAMAAMCFGYALRLYEDNPDLANNLALALDQLGEKRKALEILKRAIARYPRTDYLLINCGRIAKEIDPPEAVACYQRLVQVWPENTEYYLRYAGALLAAGNEEEAARQFSEVLRRDPANRDATQQMALLAARRNEREQASYWLGRLAQLISSNELRQLMSRPEFVGIQPPIVGESKVGGE